MKKWEYKRITINLNYAEHSESVLKELGSQGWELVAVCGSTLCVFKREAQE
jgi:hypothetical protein